MKKLILLSRPQDSTRGQEALAYRAHLEHVVQTELQKLGTEGTIKFFNGYKDSQESQLKAA